MPERTCRCVAANWKMNKTVAETEAFLDRFLARLGELGGVDVVICPPYTALAAGGRAHAAARRSGSPPRTCTRRSPARSPARSRPRCCASSASTGAILGHSERRQLFGETDEALARKVPALLDAGLLPILCVGETEAERDAGETEAVLRAPARGRPRRGSRRGPGRGRDRLRADLGDRHRPHRDARAGPGGDRASSARCSPRATPARRGAIRILYGGSVKPANAAELLRPPGHRRRPGRRRRLDPEDFLAICEAADG